jgi:hypothetical protein
MGRFSDQVRATSRSNIPENLSTSASGTLWNK